MTKTKKKRTQTPWAVILAVRDGPGGGRFHRRIVTGPKRRRHGSRSEQIASASGKDGPESSAGIRPKGNLENKGADHATQTPPTPPVAAGTENKPPCWAGAGPGRAPAVEPAVTPAASGHGNESSTGSVPPAEKPAVSSGHRQSAGRRLREAGEPSVRGPARGAGRARGRRRGEAARQGATAGAGGAEKASAPRCGCRRNGQQKLHDRYRWDLTNDNSNEEKLRLVDRLVRDADNMHGDSTGRLVMLQEAVAGPPSRRNPQGRRGLDIIGQSYDINVVAIKVDMVQNRADEVAKAAAAPGTKGRSTPAVPAGQPGSAR